MKESIKKIEKLNSDNLDMLADYLLEKSVFTTKRLVSDIRNNTLEMKDILDDLLDSKIREKEALDLINEKLEYYNTVQEVPNESKTRAKIGRDTELAIEILLELQDIFKSPRG